MIKPSDEAGRKESEEEVRVVARPAAWGK